jgi:hypothetical protein
MAPRRVFALRRNHVPDGGGKVVGGILFHQAYAVANGTMFTKDHRARAFARGGFVVLCGCGGGGHEQRQRGSAGARGKSGEHLISI